MALRIFDRVKDTTSTTGTGDVTVSGTAPTGFRTLNSVLDIGDEFPYTIISGTAWESGIGTYLGSHIFSRELTESSTGSLINLSGTSDVFISLNSAYYDMMMGMDIGLDYRLYF